jgi:hypothetical protein
MKTSYDVIVFGGGPAGITAAIQAGREGAATLLVEKTAMLGGAITLAGINAPAHFFAWGRQIISGIGWELVKQTLEETGAEVPTPEFTRDTATPKHLRVDKAVFAALCDQAVLASGAELLFHAMPAAVAFADGQWHLTVCTKTGLKQATARVLIDATGDANVVALAGLEVMRPTVVQPASLTMSCSGYNPDALDYAALKVASDQAIAAGELKSTDIGWYDNGPENFLRWRGLNANHIRAPHAETSEGRSALEAEARLAVLRAYRFFRRQPGLEKFQVDWLCPETGIRETGTIKGKHRITIQEYEAGTRYDDAICYVFYPVDEHLNDGRGINYRPLKKSVLPTIPRRAMLPVNSRFLIVAGRCIDSDTESNSALRVQAPCMAMGQVAGAMAVLSARTGLDPEELPLADLFAMLRAHGAIVPEPA